MSIEYLSHTADIKMLINAETLEGLFKNGVKGMCNILKEGFCESSHKIDTKVMIEIAATDNTSLLIDFLSDILAQSYIENVVFWDIEIIELIEYKIRAKLSGTQVETFDEEIKAVTYHEANVSRNDEGFWCTSIIFDI
ncbi:archease [Psychroserpens sp.]|uniref:archease n=1 Tax=Psychroserpens sp. TaxID=2020870 RepID=UPI002B277114|nr:archease [Psychroserpens sp.]